MRSIVIDNTLELAQAMTTAGVADKSITAAKMALFVSDEQTGTGSAQTIAHGLGVTPSKVIIVPTNVPSGGYAVTEGTHGTTNVSVTVTTGAKFKVVAIA